MQISDSADAPLPKHRSGESLPENIIIVSDISIFADHLDAIVDMEFRSFNPPWTKSDFTEELKNADAQVLLLLADDMPVGYLCARNAFDETNINKICIHPDVRGRGYGKWLLCNLLGSFTGSQRKIFLEVARSNESAIGLYSSSGFRVNRVRSKIYHNGDDALEMVLMLA